MCKETREKINKTKGLSNAEKRAFDMVMDEIGKVNHQLNELTDDFAQLKESAVNQAKTTIEILELVNTINERLTVQKIDEDAAQMRGLRAAAKQKRFWYVVAAIIASFVMSGVAIAYFIEHSRQVKEIAEIGHVIKGDA